jgi:hypothetical protein
MRPTESPHVGPVAWTLSNRMNNYLLFALIIIIQIGAHLSAGQSDASRTEEKGAAVRFILAQVECGNPVEVAEIVFASQDASLFSEPKWESRCAFSKENLGDGKKAYVFCPPWGNGQWGFRPSYHFEKIGVQACILNN